MTAREENPLNSRTVHMASSISVLFPFKVIVFFFNSSVAVVSETVYTFV